MPTDPEKTNGTPDKAAKAPDAAVDASSGKSAMEPEVVASPPSVVAEPSPALTRLKAYCDQLNLNSRIELFDNFHVVCIDFPNGRATRTVYIGSEDEADALMQYPLGEIVFLGEYAAICSYAQGWIEAAVRGHGLDTRGAIARRNIGSPEVRGSEQPQELEIVGPEGLTLRLTEKQGCLYSLDYGAQLYVRIEGVGITEHDKAQNLLEDLSNALFLQIDLRFGSPITLAKSRFSFRRSSRSRGKLDEDRN